MKYILLFSIFGITGIVYSIMYPKSIRDISKRVKGLREDNTTFQENYTKVKEKAYNSIFKKIDVEREARKRASMMVDKSPTSKVNQTERLLSSAGLTMSKNTFFIIRISLGCGLALISYIALSTINIKALTSSDVMLCSLMFGIIGMLLPMVIVKSKAKKAKKELLNSMADMMDLLSISTCAGLGIDAALIKMYEYEKSPSMEQMMIALTDIQHGVPRKIAYQNMAKRCDLKEMTAFVNAMIQADEMGISISNVLSAQSEILRETRRLNAEEAAEKAPIKMTIPLVFCMFPAIFVVLLGPAAMDLFAAFAEMAI